MLRPIKNRIVVKADPPDEMTKSGIILPDSVKERPASGVVAASGSPEVSIGDKVLFSEWGGNEVDMGEETYVVLDVRDILAVVEDDAS